MSCQVMNPEPLAAVANATATLLNCGFDYYGFGAPEKLFEALEDCRDGTGFYVAEEIYGKLYAVNARAYNGRYKDHQPRIDEGAPIIDGSRYIINKPPVFAEHHHAVQPWHYHLAKLLDFWLYQTGEDATWSDPTRAAMSEFHDALFRFIVQRCDAYDNAPGWGKL